MEIRGEARCPVVRVFSGDMPSCVPLLLYLQDVWCCCCVLCITLTPGVGFVLCCAACSNLGGINKRLKQCPYQVVCRNLSGKIQKAKLYVDGHQVSYVDYFYVCSPRISFAPVNKKLLA